MIDALAALLRACRAAQVTATVEDALDAAWLIQWRTTEQAPEKKVVHPPPKQPEVQEPDTDSGDGKNPWEGLSRIEGPEPTDESEDALEDAPDLEYEPDLSGESVGVYLPSVTGTGAAGRAFRAPGAPALARPLELARALRPLARRVASRTRFVLSVGETVRRFADERICTPVLRPARERWLRLVLVIDAGAGADLWRETAREFRILLACLGAFRDVRTWSLDTDHRPPRLVPGTRTGTGAVPRHPKELNDSVGRTLTVVLSPCIGAGWHDGGAARILGEWAASGPVVLVPLLPECLWPRTALAQGTTVRITAPAAGVPNRRLMWTVPGAWPGEDAPDGVTVPVAVLEPRSMKRWAELVAGRGGAAAPGFILDTAHAAPPPALSGPEPTAAERVERFHNVASPLARRLAKLLAAAPVINLPIVRLVRESLLPDAGQPQEAEVLFGGLLIRTPSVGDDVRFEFLPRVREALLDAAPTDESLAVLEAVSDYLGERLASGRTFRTVLADPASAEGEVIADAGPFARVAAEVLVRAGGAYARMVGRRKKKPASPKEPHEEVAEIRSGDGGGLGTVAPVVDPRKTTPQQPLNDRTEPEKRSWSTTEWAELEAITEVLADPSKSATQARQYGRRFALVAGKPMHLGRDEGKMDIAIPEDDQISRFQAILLWEPRSGELTVQTRPSLPPGYSTPPANQTLIFDEKQKKLIEAPGGKCVVGRGESFWIGQTRFTLHYKDQQDPESASDTIMAPRQEERTRAQLEDIPFANPGAALRAMEQLPATIRAVTSEQGLFRQMLKVVMDAMPRADAAVVVRIPPDTPDGEPRLTLVESNVRPRTSHGPHGFVPARRLVYRAVVERRRSCLHCWSSDPGDYASTGAELSMTMADDHVYGVTPWAVCTPFQDGSKYALYVAGQTAGQWNLIDKPAQDKIVSDLTQYQKIAELIVGMIETTLRVSRLTQQNKIIRRLWPESLWKYLDDPNELERVLEPKEQEITPLFCDLRNYSLFAAQRAENLLQAQQAVGTCVSTVSRAITDSDGVVAGFRADAALGFWGWPSGHDKQVILAARAALSIHERLSGWSQGARLGLGLAHGTAVVGRLGASDLTVADIFGPLVSRTYRLAGLASVFGVGIVIDDRVANRLRLADPHGREMLTRPLGKVRAKGFPEALWAHELYSAHTPSIPDSLHAEWAEAIEFFTGGDWRQAYEILTEEFSTDPAAQCLLRVMDRTQRRPPNDWDGSFVPPFVEG